jgi:hypothetical protein
VWGLRWIFVGIGSGDIVIRRGDVSFQVLALLLPGVDVMITIFCDFRQFSAKKLAFFSKTNVMIIIFAKTSSSLSKKRQFFAKFFGENI